MPVGVLRTVLFSGGWCRPGPALPRSPGELSGSCWGRPAACAQRGPPWSEGPGPGAASGAHVAGSEGWSVSRCGGWGQERRTAAWEGEMVGSTGRASPAPHRLSWASLEGDAWVPRIEGPSRPGPAAPLPLELNSALPSGAMMGHRGPNNTSLLQLTYKTPIASAEMDF